MTTTTFTITRYACDTCGAVISHVANKRFDHSDADEEFQYAGIAFEGSEASWPPGKPRISFAGFESDKATEIGDVHFCSNSCKAEYATKHHVLRFDDHY